MAEPITEEKKQESKLDEVTEVFDLLSQSLMSRKEEDNSSSSEDLARSEEDVPSGAASDREEVEDLEIETEELAQRPPNVEHLQPAVHHENLQSMVDGKLNGVVQAHDQEGNLLSHHYYEDGVLQGEARKYDGEQRLRDRVTYLDGVPHGPAEFYRNGRALMNTHYNYGELHGETSYYDPNSGMVTARVNHENGKKNGTTITYDALGKPQRILHYVDGELEGPAFSYHPDGGVQQEGYYLQGRKHGQFTSYYLNGETRRVEFYENGRLTRKPVLYTPGGEEFEPKY